MNSHNTGNQLPDTGIQLLETGNKINGKTNSSGVPGILKNPLWLTCMSSGTGWQLF